MRTLLATATIVALAALSGCGDNCQDTCQHVYNTCGITKPGRDQQTLIRTCTSECNGALQVAGELGDYDPNRRRSASAEAIELENDQQAAAWIDCVWDIAPDGTPEQCQQLDPSIGYCSPI